ncbi:MAG: DedA family protein [Chloroflexota bacterium]
MHFSTTALEHLLNTWGYLAVFVFVAVESTGIPFPGETMLVTAGVYAGAGNLQIPLVIGFGAAGAIIGDNIGYVIGHTAGRQVVLRYGKYVRLDEAKLRLAEAFFQRHGDKTVFLGRFVAVLRAWAAFLAGVNRMPWPKFLFFNATGGICWAVLFGMLAFELGKNLQLLHKVETAVGIGGVVVAALAVVVLYVLHVRRKRARKARDEETTASQERDTASI